MERQIFRRKVRGMPRFGVAESTHHDRLKEKSHRDFGSNPIHGSIVRKERKKGNSVKLKDSGVL